MHCSDKAGTTRGHSTEEGGEPPPEFQKAWPCHCRAARSVLQFWVVLLFKLMAEI